LKTDDDAPNKRVSAGRLGGLFGLNRTDAAAHANHSRQF